MPCEDRVHCLSPGSEKCIPKSQPPSYSAVQGWNEYVRQFRESSIFWHNIWKLECFLAPMGWVSQIRRKARGEYHKAVRKVKRDRDRHADDRMATSLASNRDLWSECRKINRAKQPTPSITDDQHVASVFSQNYNTMTIEYRTILWMCRIVSMALMIGSHIRSQ